MLIICIGVGSLLEVFLVRRVDKVLDGGDVLDSHAGFRIDCTQVTAMKQRTDLIRWKHEPCEEQGNRPGYET